MMGSKKLLLLLIAAGLAFTLNAYAENVPAKHTGSGIKLTASVDLSRQVTAQRLSITVLASSEQADPVKAQNSVASEVHKALKGLPKGVKAASAGYNAYQVQQGKDKSKVWRVSEQLELRGDDRNKLWTAAQAMAGSGLIIQSLNYHVGRARRDRIKNQLIRRAVHRLRVKMKVMAKALGCQSTHFISIHTGSSHQRPRPVVMSAARAPGAHAPPPARQTLKVQAHAVARAQDCH